MIRKAGHPDPGRTAPPAEEGEAQPREGRSFQASLAASRQLLPLPEEMVYEADTETGDRLAARINAASLGQATIRLAHELTSRELRAIFPLLAGRGDPEIRSGKFPDKLYMIIRERACPSLYQNGWILFQQTYPCPAVARAMSILCGILEIKRETGGGPAPLISDLAAPDARHFIRQLMRALSRDNIPLEAFMKQYHVSGEWPLGAALIGACFLNQNAGLYEGGQSQFNQILGQVDLDLQAGLLHHLFSQTDLPPDTRNRYYQIVYRQFGDPAAGHPVWEQLKKREVAAFRRWVVAATIGSHCRKSPEKARFYLRYAEHISQIETWDDYTLLLYFPGFVIADNRRQPLLALYYDQPQPIEHPFGLAGTEQKQNPASLEIPHRRVEDAIRRASSQGIIGLPFDEEGIRYSGVFLNFCLQERLTGGRRHLFRRPAGYNGYDAGDD
ncbi:MAG: hypothetical protein VB070_09745 [Clostridiaceae bacterium]|nr:hypothetical protein [Clostridiaceae bacterium]